MDFEEKFSALLNDPERALLLFDILRYIYLGMMVLGFLIIFYLISGLTSFFYLGVGVAIGASVGYLIYKLLGERVFKY